MTALVDAPVARWVAIPAAVLDAMRQARPETDTHELVIRALHRKGVEGFVDYDEPDYEQGVLRVRVAPTARDLNVRPDAKIVRLAPGVKDSRAGEVAEMIAAAQPGLTMVQIKAAARQAVAARVPTRDVEVRDQIAEALGKPPHLVELRVAWTVDEDTDRIRPAEIVLYRWPAPLSGEARFKSLRELTRTAVPWASDGWTVRDDVADQVATLTYGAPPRLPFPLALDAILPAAYDPDGWGTLPFGVYADGSAAALDLKSGPHALVVGPTGSGKTVQLLAAISSALCRGHRLVLVDPTKAGLDFDSIRPWAHAWAVEDLGEAAKAVQMVYDEVRRRRSVLQQIKEVKWADASDEQRAEHDLVPMTLLIDEFGSLVLDEPIPKGLDRSHPLVVEATERNAHRAVIKSVVGKIAREARFAGIHLQIALQRPDVAVMGSGELRSNLTSAVQLVKAGSAPSRDALAMVFPADQVEAAQEQVAALDRGGKPGLAIVGAEGGTARGARVAFTPMKEIPALLDARGVPRVDPEDVWDVSDPDGEDPMWDPSPRKPKAKPREVDLGEVDLTFDLEDAPPPEDAQPPLDDIWGDPT